MEDSQSDVQAVMDADILYNVVIPAGALLFLPPIAEHVIRRVRRRRRLSREAPVLDIVFGFPWLEEWRSELAYRDRLAHELFLHLQPQQKTEEPLPTGTRVDLVVRIPRAEFYVTIKRGLDNQARLKLQGEIGEIERTLRQAGRNATIVVVIGFPPDEEPAKIDSQIQTLEGELARRRFEFAKEWVGIEFLVVRVPIGTNTPDATLPLCLGSAPC